MRLKSLFYEFIDLLELWLFNLLQSYCKLTELSKLDCLWLLHFLSYLLIFLNILSFFLRLLENSFIVFLPVFFCIRKWNLYYITIFNGYSFLNIVFLSLSILKVKRSFFYIKCTFLPNVIQLLNRDVFILIYYFKSFLKV